MHDGAKNELVRRVERVLGGLNNPFYFEQDMAGAEIRGKCKLLGADEEAKLRAEILNAVSFCDSLGFRFVLCSGVSAVFSPQLFGDVSLAIIVFAEDLSKDEMIGRAILVKNSVAQFGKFSPKTTWNIPIHVELFYVFGSSEKAFTFRNVVQDMCQHTKLRFSRTIQVKPWGIDFQGMHVAGPKGLLSGLHKEPLEIESKLFGKA